MRSITEFLDAPDSALLVAIDGGVELVTTRHETATKLTIERFPLGPVANVDAVLALLDLHGVRPAPIAAPAARPALAAPVAATPDLPCPECGQEFTRKDSLRRHRRLLHGVVGTSRKLPADEDRPFVCPDCGQGYKRRDHLNRHARDIHPHTTAAEEATADVAASSDQGSVCTICSRTFKNQKGLDVHTNRLHRNLNWSTKPKHVADPEPDPEPSPPAAPPEHPWRSSYKTAKPAAVADGSCPVCHEPLATHEKCDGCGVLIGPTHATIASVFVSGLNLCHDCARGRIAARKADLVAGAS